MRKTATSATATTTTTSAAPHEGAPPPTSGNDSPHPSPPRRSAPAAGPAATSATSPHAPHAAGLNDVLGPANWSCRVEPADRWVRCSLTIILPDGKAVTREAVGGYPEMPTDEDKVKGGDSDAFKRACVLFGIGEYLYGDEPAEPAEPRPTSNGDGRGEPRNVPRDRISFPDARAFYGWLKDNGHLGLAEEIGDREDFPVRDHPLDARADRRWPPWKSWRGPATPVDRPPPPGAGVRPASGPATQPERIGATAPAGADKQAGPWRGQFRSLCRAVSVPGAGSFGPSARHFRSLRGQFRSLRGQFRSLCPGSFGPWIGGFYRSKLFIRQ